MIRILIVDDQRIIRHQLRKRLELEADFSVIGEAKNGIEAIIEASKLVPDVILMNVEMPEMDGIVATNVLSRNIPGCAVIILTIHDDKVTAARAQSAGAFTYIPKNNIDELLAQIRMAGQKTSK